MPLYQSPTLRYPTCNLAPPASQAKSRNKSGNKESAFGHNLKALERSGLSGAMLKATLVQVSVSWRTEHQSQGGTPETLTGKDLKVLVFKVPPKVQAQLRTSNQGSHPASSGGRHNIPEWSPPLQPTSTSQARCSPSGSDHHSSLAPTNQPNLAPWEISVFEPSDFFHYGVGVGGLHPDPLSLGDSSLSDNWLTGAVDNGSFGLDLTGLDWSEGARPAPLPAFDISHILQNDVYDHILATTTTTMPNTAALTVTTMPSSANVTPLQQSPSSTLSHDFGSETTPPFSASTEPTGQRNSRKRSPPVDPETAIKRQRNNIAARKYRQKKIDRISELEAELKEVKDDRDDLRVRLARQEAEVAALKSLFKIKGGFDV
ncbi:hypothetical protein PFICI_09208 [Pestalotiopsis fici W106-1]|uniref:BZIP domain-containing protein n=1 Tax=Pestalotiopsis fici (strain W106-1 / CGMCC3.15140) TaxID=1229662 RepID=W3WZT5_PESFW|nr:uncharacterized protein PFICI_09208 [Pestalotiopsis fici W106-1]ETS79355.1 hypothetical protein PFICI_09208 [Pestalotiopsis fici W106-1]